jgi:hypothetical protein
MDRGDGLPVKPKGPKSVFRKLLTAALVTLSLTSAAYAKSQAQYDAEKFSYVSRGAEVCGHPDWMFRMEVVNVGINAQQGRLTSAQWVDAVEIGVGGFNLAVKIHGKALACQRLDATWK